MDSAAILIFDDGADAVGSAVDEGAGIFLRDAPVVLDLAPLLTGAEGITESSDVPPPTREGMADGADVPPRCS